MDQQEQDELSSLIEDGYIDSNLQPLKCTNCDEINIKEKTESTIAGQIAEKSCYCGDCKKELGYWAYGAWQL